MDIVCTEFMVMVTLREEGNVVESIMFYFFIKLSGENMASGYNLRIY